MRLWDFQGKGFTELIPELIHFELDRLIIELFLFYLISFNVFYVFLFVFVVSFCGTRAYHCCGLSRCGAQALDAQAQRSWLTGPAALWHVGSSRTGAQTRVPCIGRQTLNHCVTREAQEADFYGQSTTASDYRSQQKIKEVS